MHDREKHLILTHEKQDDPVDFFFLFLFNLHFCWEKD